VICHPGSIKVVDAIEEALRLDNGVLDHERQVLQEFSNMAAPTVLFVLERFAKDRAAWRYVMAALGPGFTPRCCHQIRMTTLGTEPFTRRGRIVGDPSIQLWPTRVIEGK